MEFTNKKTDVKALNIFTFSEDLILVLPSIINHTEVLPADCSAISKIKQPFTYKYIKKVYVN